MIDMSKMFLLEDVDLALYSHEKLVNLLERIEKRKKEIREAYPQGTPKPTVIQSEIRYMLGTISNLYRERHEQLARLN